MQASLRRCWCIIAHPSKSYLGFCRLSTLRTDIRRGSKPQKPPSEVSFLFKTFKNIHAAAENLQKHSKLSKTSSSVASQVAARCERRILHARRGPPPWVPLCSALDERFWQYVRASGSVHWGREGHIPRTRAIRTAERWEPRRARQRHGSRRRRQGVSRNHSGDRARRRCRCAPNRYP